MKNDSWSFESLLWVNCLIILGTTHSPLCERCLTRLTEKEKYFETLTDWLRSRYLAEEQKRVLHSSAEQAVKLCLTTQCACVISDLLKTSIKAWVRWGICIINTPSGSLYFHLTAPMTCSSSAWLFRSFSINFKFQFVDAESCQDGEDHQRD